MRRLYRPTPIALALGLAVSVLVLAVLRGLPFFADAELKAYDMQMRQRGELPAPQHLAFVGLDQTTIDFLGNGSYPLKRCVLADAVNFLHRAHARAIALDFVFQTETSAKCDRALATAVHNAGNAVLAEALSTGDANNFVGSETHLAAPIDVLQHATSRIGVANFFPDSDGVIRRGTPLQTGPGSHLYPSFSLQIASVVEHRSPQSIAASLPHDFLINYLGRQDPSDSSFSILTRQLTGVATNQDSPAFYRNKVVVIGCAAIMCVDIKSSPFGDMYGAVVEANAVNTILNHDPITPAGDVMNGLIVLALGIITTLAVSRRGLWFSLAAAAGTAVLYALLTFVLFEHFQTWIDLVVPETTIVLVLAVVMAFRFGTEERQRRRTAQKFGLYVTPAVVETLINASDEEKALAGARRPISVLFVDVRGFTSMSENMEPEDVVSALDVYLEELTSSVQMYEGTVVKYVGDELMAMWNAPKYHPDHPMRAVKSALDMLARMDSVNEQLRARGLPAIAYGIGVNSGEVVVGEMGSSFRKQYDVIGDTVNTGARLCSAAGRGEIIIGQNTWEMVGDQLDLEETEELRLKGKRQALRTFKVLGVKSQRGAPVAAGAPA